MGPSPGASLARWVSAWLAPELPGVFQVGRPGPSTNQLNQGLGTGDGAAALIRPCGSDVQRTLRTKTGTSSSEPFTPSGLEGWADSDRVPKSASQAGRGLSGEQGEAALSLEKACQGHRPASGSKPRHLPAT